MHLGNELLVYCPNPNYPFLPAPQDHISPSFVFSEHTPQGSISVAATAEALKNLLKFIKIIIKIKILESIYSCRKLGSEEIA